MNIHLSSCSHCRQQHKAGDLGCLSGVVAEWSGGRRAALRRRGAGSVGEPSRLQHGKASNDGPGRKLRTNTNQQHSQENKQDGYEVLGSLFISMFFMLARVQQREPPEAPSCQCGIYSGHALQIVHPTPSLQDNQWPVLYKKNGQHQKGQSITNRNETRSSTGR
jgi:hypothetical protein